MFAFPNLKVTRMNLASLLSGSMFTAFRPEKFLAEVQRQLMKSIRQRIRQETFSPEAKKRLTQGFEVRVGRNSVTVIAKDPAFRPLLEGQRPGQMRWLVKAKGPIPIVTDSGELIFRSATPRSMSNGSWYHPGREPTTVIEQAKAEVRDFMRTRAKELMLKQLRAEMQKSR